MANISVSLPSDGETIDAADYNTPITTIVSEINGNLDNSNIASGAAIAGSKLANTSVTDSKIDWSTLQANMLSATNGSIITPTNSSQNLAANGLSLSFNTATACKALVTVSIGCSSTTDFEFQPQIRLGGTVVASFTPSAAAGNASSRATVRSFSAVIDLASGSNTVSAGLTLTSAASPSINTNGAYISAFVMGEIV